MEFNLKLYANFEMLCTEKKWSQEVEMLQYVLFMLHYMNKNLFISPSDHFSQIPSNLT